MLNDISMNGWNVIHDKEIEGRTAEDMFDQDNEEWGPNEDVRKVADNPISLFFKTMPKALWREIAEETTNYELQTRAKRILDHKKRYSKDQHSRFLSKVNNVVPVKAYEIVRYIGLLVHHASSPRNDMKHHWRQKDSCAGVETAGTFGKIMFRDRFMHISRYSIYIMHIFHLP